MTSMKQVQLRQGPVAYRDMGKGDPIVLIHGLLVNGELWRDLAPRLAQDFRVIVPELPLGSQRAAARGGQRRDAARARRADRGAARRARPRRRHARRQRHRRRAVPDRRHQALRSGSRGSCSRRATRTSTSPRRRSALMEIAKVPGAMIAIAAVACARPQRAGCRRHTAALPSDRRRAHASWIAPALDEAARARASSPRCCPAFAKRYTLAAAERFGEFKARADRVGAAKTASSSSRYAERLPADVPRRAPGAGRGQPHVRAARPARANWLELIAAFAREPLPDGAVQARAVDAPRPRKRGRGSPCARPGARSQSNPPARSPAQRVGWRRRRSARRAARRAPMPPR